MKQFSHAAGDAAHCDRRKRGGLLIDVILGLLLLVGLLAGAYAYFQQGSSSSEQSALNSRFVALSADVRQQYFTVSGYGTGDITTAVESASSLPASAFDDTVITGGSNFTIEISGIPENICNNLALQNLGPESTADATSCSTGSLTVTYD